MRTYEREIREYKEMNLYETIRTKQKAIEEKLGAKQYEIMNRESIEKAYKKRYNMGNNWTFKDQLLQQGKSLTLTRW